MPILSPFESEVLNRRRIQLCRAFLFYFMPFFINNRAYIARRSMSAVAIIKHLSVIESIFFRKTKPIFVAI
ncbi:MAG: hypothetical protein B6I25_00600 [Planctomycetales bacterium 4572_13]|nr:MAG: hypothetical protein B6I25_00600 [Planctomycetales bacterium 4572_13]